MAWYRCIGGNDSGGGNKKIVDFNFTDSLTDSVQGIVATINNAEQNSSGVHLSTTSSYIDIPDMLLIFDLIQTGYGYLEIDVGEIAKRSGGDHRRFLMWTDIEGLIYRTNAYWAVYNDGWYFGDSELKDFDELSNSTIRIESKNYVLKIYVNDVLLHSISMPRMIKSTRFRIGASGASIIDVHIRALRVYLEA